MNAPTPNQVQALLDLHRSADHAGAERLARQLTVRFARHPFAWKVLCASLQAQGRTADALKFYHRAAPLLTMDAEFHNNFGNALRHANRLLEAEARYRRALILNPEYAEGYNNLGLVLHLLDRLSESEESFFKAIHLRPTYAEAHRNLATLYQSQGRFAEAEVRYLESLALKPDDHGTHNNLGTLYLNWGKPELAVTAYRNAIAHKPDDAEAHSNLGWLYKTQGDLAGAESALRRALQLRPGYPEAANSLGVFLQELGQLDEAEALFRTAMLRVGGFPAAHSNLLFLLQHRPGVDPTALFAEYRDYARQVEGPLRGPQPRHLNLSDPDRPLNVGFVSADLRDHPLERYFIPVLEDLRRHHPDLILHAYANHLCDDARTADYRRLFHHWRGSAHLSDTALARHIRSDGIDILIDLSGHTGHNRLPVFARRPAPVQMSWIGYVGTTGLDAMDYFLSDLHLVPPEFLTQFSEKVLYLPAATPFRPVASAPDVHPLPALSAGVFTFGSFNRLGKLNADVFRAWGAILNAIPESRLLLASMPAGPQAQAVVNQIAAHGISPSRIVLQPASTVDDTLRVFHQVDLCLDSFPHNGSTTSNHALWMGVPTLTLAGDTPAGRIGTALNRTVGLEEFIASNQADYIGKAIALAGDLHQLADLRPRLRQRFAESLFLDSPRITAAIAAQLRKAWQRWCSE